MPLMLTPEGVAVDVPADQVVGARNVGYKDATPAQAAADLTRPDTGAEGLGGAVLAGASSALSGATLGGSDVLLAGFGNRGDVEAVRAAREAHPITSGVTGVVGALAPAILTGGESLVAAPTRFASGVGRAATEAAGEAGLSRFGAAAVGGAAEGALYGAGAAASELSLSQDPLTVERVGSALGSNLLYGAGFGAVGGAAAKGLEVGLGKAKQAVNDLSDRLQARSAVTPAADAASADIATLDAKGLKVAEQAELDAIDETRKPLRKQFVDELTDFGSEMRDARLSESTSGAHERESREAGKKLMKADMGIRNLTDNPLHLAERPQTALKNLQAQQTALEDMLRVRDLEHEAWANMRDTIREEVAAGKVKGMTGPFTDQGLENAVDTVMSKRFGATGAKRTAATLTDEEIAALGKRAAETGDGGLATSVRVAQSGKYEPSQIPTSISKKMKLQLREAGVDPGAISIMTPEEAWVKLGGKPRTIAAAAVARARDQLADIHNGLITYKPPARLAALDKVPAALDRNLKLQAKLGEIMAEPASDRLSKIAAAKEALGVPKEPSLGQAVLNAAAPFAGPLGAAAAAGNKVLGNFKKIATVAGARATKAVGSILGAAERGAARATPIAPVLATKILARVRYSDDQPGRRVAAAQTLPQLFEARAQEVRGQVQVAPDGTHQMRPEARQKLAAKFDGIRAADPVLADQLEELGARRLEYLASILPRLPDYAATYPGSSPGISEFAMRSWARSAAALERPQDVFARALAGHVTLEDAAAIRHVYPEMLGSYLSQVGEGRASRKKPLPFKASLALSMLSGQPQDPSLEPAVLSILQGSFTKDDGSPATQAPQAMPAFGSVKRSVPEPTPSQRRAQGAT